MKVNKSSKNYSIVKSIRNRNDCLFKDILIKCHSEGKKKTEKNHLIPKSHYLERISDKDQVYVFDFENNDYIKNKRKLTIRNIKNANKYRVLCGSHDKYLFSEIENNMKFDLNNKKQLFQFSMRAFIFSFSEHLIKSDKRLNNIVSPTANHISNAHLCYEIKTLEKFKQCLIEQNWDATETIPIILNRKIDFISCYYGHPMLGLHFPINLGKGKISINVFPENNDTVILLSYFKNAPGYNSMKRYCNKLLRYSKTNEKKFIIYMNKFLAAFDHNITIGPKYWDNEINKDNFYEIAHMFPKCKSTLQGIKLLIDLKSKECIFNLIPLE